MNTSFSFVELYCFVSVYLEAWKILKSLQKCLNYVIDCTRVRDNLNTKTITYLLKGDASIEHMPKNVRKPELITNEPRFARAFSAWSFRECSDVGRFSINI